jgi:hypothetical protein
LEKIKEKAIIKEASMNYFEFLTDLISTLVSWEHVVVKKAN